MKRSWAGGVRQSVWHNFSRTLPSNSLTRLYFPAELQTDAEVDLEADAAHYLTRVLRVPPGATVTLFDGRGGECPAAVTAVGKHRVTVRVGPRRAVDRESPLRLHVVQGLSAGERMDYTVQKAVELGVATIQPVATERSVVHLDAQRAAKRVAHWRAIAVAACAQCGRNTLPEIAPVLSYTAWLGQLAPGAAARLVMRPLEGRRLRDVPPADEAWLLCGPEGGLTAAEEALALRAGFTGVTLGPRVLRTETAAVAALAALQALWGDF